MMPSARQHRADPERRRLTIRTELDRRRELGVAFVNREVMTVTGYDRKTISGVTQRYVSELAAELLETVVEDREAYERWVRDYRTFRPFITRTESGPALFRRFVRLVIEQLHRENALMTVNAVETITGGRKRILNEELVIWEQETGHQVARTVAWKSLDTSGATVLVGENHTLNRRNESIKAELDRRRQIGTPFKLIDISRCLGFSVATVSGYSRHYVAALADELLSAPVDSREAYESWRRDFNTFRYSLPNTRRSREVLTRLTRLTIEHLHREGYTVAYSEVLRLSGHNVSRIKQEIRRWEEETGHRASPLRVWKEITLEMVLDSVSPALHHLPLTFLESPTMGRPFNDSQRRMIHSISQPKLRDVAFFVMTFADGNRRNDITFFANMSRYLTRLKLPDIDALDPEVFYRRYHDGEILPEEGTPKRGRFLQTYFRLLRKQEDYLLRLTPKQRRAVVPWKLIGLKDDHFWHRSTLHRDVRTDQRMRRKAATAVVHDRFYLLRDVAERRCIQVERLHTAFQDAMAHHEREGEALPMSFSITDETVSTSGRTRSTQQHFRLWDAATLRSVHEPVAEDFYYHQDQRQRIRATICDQARYFLSYEGGHACDDATLIEPYWFIELLQANVLKSQVTDSDFLTHNGYSKGAFQLPPHSTWGLSTSHWLERVSRDLGMLFIPLDALKLAALVGYAAIQIMTKTGARMNEFLQIRLSPEHLSRVLLAKDREAIAFRAIPKGRRAEEPYYIDERCMKALHAWWKFQRDRGQDLETIPPTRSLRHKLRAASYLWQHAGRHFSHKDVNATMSIMLHGISLQTAAGEAVRVTSHLLRHGFATEMRALNTPVDVIALLMKQRDVRVTEYYSQPTPARLMELQQKIFESRVDLSRTHVRSPGQIRRQIEAAQEQVGALIPVIGGRCTVASQCPIKFACIGCAGNAPDWHKRDQVIVYRQACAQMAEMAEAQNLPAEGRKAKESMASCDDVLAEMELLERADQAAADPVILTIGRKEK
ncbi:site-specific integrase [Halomonas sp. M20]|uniref:Phage integrase family protein n=1 Tax=Modicisalibacter ilicicola DSM 19980 TaxID=1121942 RepID=A0A1M5CX51_9GAMM|nr:site-specific integrase [Halomonas sp. M20]SHF59328.1 Phage integrase family protein [Halomonas ilicicola DSM 19980]